MNEIDCLGDYFDVILSNRWDIYALENHDLISIDVQHLIMHSMSPSTCIYIQKNFIYNKISKNFKKKKKKKTFA
jgi:hypothetical protein